MTVTGGAGGVKDFAGNALASSATWSFTTGAADTTAPTVTSQSPAAGVIGVAVGTTVTATFNEALTAEHRDDEHRHPPDGEHHAPRHGEL